MKAIKAIENWRLIECTISVRVLLKVSVSLCAKEECNKIITYVKNVMKWNREYTRVNYK